MANNFPVIPSLQVASLQYAVNIAGISGAVNSMPVSEFRLINFGFEQAANPDGTIPFDYTGFDQDAHETQMRALLNGISGAMAVNLALPVAAIQAAMTITRIWSFMSPSQVSGAYPSVTVTEQMAYP